MSPEQIAQMRERARDEWPTDDALDEIERLRAIIAARVEAARTEYARFDRDREFFRPYYSAFRDGYKAALDHLEVLDTFASASSSRSTP